MSGPQARRRLAALLVADVADYSLHMARNDAETLIAMRALREEVQRTCAGLGGRVVDAVGDEFLAEFPSVVDAATAATQLMQSRKREAAASDHALRLRAAIHVGDLLEDEDGRLYGDAVNVTARVMPLARPDGILLSAAATNHLGHRSEFSTRFVGEFAVKNVSQPIQVHELMRPDTPHDRQHDEDPASMPLEALSGLPALAVLPFDNMSQDPEQDFLADGLVEDLITALAFSRGFSVIARNSTFVYKGRPVSIPEVGRELGARYVVEGSIRRSGSRVRVTGQLIDTTTGAHVWAERYDRRIDDLFDLQDELVLAITGALIPSVQGAERARAMAKPQQDLNAWECLHRGLWHLGQHTADEQEQACAFFERASRFAPRWGMPLAAQALSRVLSITFGISKDVQESVASGLALAEQAVQLSPNDAEAHHALGWIGAFARNYALALGAFERGIHLNPSAAGCHHGLGFVHSLLDRADLAIGHLERSILLSPRDPQLHFRRGHLGQAYLQLERYDDSIREVRSAIALRQDFGFYYLLAAALGHAGQCEEGRAILREAQARFPRHRVEHLKTFLSPSLYATHEAGLARLTHQAR